MFTRVTTSVVFRALALTALLMGSVPVSAQEPNDSTPVEVGLVPLVGDTSIRPAQGGAAVGNMTWHGGPVQHMQKIYTIFWNPSGTPFPAGYQTTINQFVQDLNGSPYYAIASQYGDPGQISTALTFGGTWLDTTNAIPHNPPTTTDLQNEVNRAKAANGWTADANSYFQIYTPSGIGNNTGYCGFHVTTSQPYGLILFPASHGAQGTCIPAGPFPHSDTIDVAINISAHEILETVTDPQFSGWYFVDGGGEIGDLCNFDFGPRAGDGSNVTLNGRKYLVQQEWSNAISGCTLSYAAPTVRMTANGQDGPLTLPVNSPLQIAITANGGAPGFANPSDLYIGVSTPGGLFWLGSTGFTSTAGALYHGPLASFGPLPLLSIPNASALPSGSYVWFIIATGGTNAAAFDTVQTTVP